ncbi:chitin synthesis regulation, congo red resistance, RCR protein [Exophiala viscosa]|uniref:Chitin synthesis regulation, congo red resistance, RCR protein n=1 Tax=Exophiala viscosa TaxID=2486360 RepID=A0AAN6DRK7_9EURO|nr:chitin synthesis regulation, congo red resistance, RCR protein [Exophiala viscosa]KAI1625038.1 chitin synthesis regulation, congo red resistance, RCR protein [Exophiala viscosa]
MARCYDSNNNAYRCNTGWSSWGRWVALAVILVAAFLFFFLCSCLTARRRRKAGRQPYYGTGWVGRTPWGHGQAQYNPNYQTQQQQQPSYQPQTENYNANQGGYYGQNQGYFGGRQTDVEMQPPSNTYQGGENVYQPPAGPPPAKK